MLPLDRGSRQKVQSTQQWLPISRPGEEAAENLCYINTFLLHDDPSVNDGSDYFVEHLILRVVQEDLEAFPVRRADLLALS